MNTTTTDLDARRERERAKYLELESRPGSSYGSTNHGKDAVSIVLGWKPRFVVDFGCGRNLFIEGLRRRGVDGLGVDFAFPEADIQRPMHATGLLDAVADVVTSFDALEHLLPEDVDAVLAEMRRVARPRAWFCLSICPHASRTTVNGEGLHPTVRPIAWWVERIRRVGSVHETRAACQSNQTRYITGRFTTAEARG